MKKLIFFVFVLSFTACAEKEWTKDALTNECLRDFNKKNEAEKRFDPAKIPYLCHCITDKMIATYKSEKESSKDKEGVQQIGADCAREIFSK